MTEALPEFGRNATRIEVGHALWTLDRSQEGLDGVLDMLARDADPELRKRAADRLRTLDGDEARVDTALGTAHHIGPAAG